MMTATVFALAFGVTALLRARRRVDRLSFGAGAVVLAFWLFAVGSIAVSRDPGVVGARVAVAAALSAILPIPWTFVTIVFARESRPAMLRRWRFYLIGLSLAGLYFAARSLFGGVVPVIGQKAGDYVLFLDGTGRAMGVYLVASIVVMLFNLETTARCARGAELAKAKFALIGLAAVMVYHLFVLSLATVYSTVSVQHLVAGSVPILAAGVLIAYSVARRRLADAHVRVGRPVFYGSVTTFIAGTYLMTLGAVALVARSRGWGVSSLGVTSLVFLALLLLAMFFASSRVRRGIRRFIDSNFYVSRYDYRREWETTSEALSGATSEREVLAAVVKVVRDSLDASTVVVAGVDRSTCPAAVRVVGDARTEHAAAIGDPALLALLSERGEAVRIGMVDSDPALDGWVARHPAPLSGPSPDLVVPLIAAREVVGVALVSLGSARRTYEDLEILSTLGRQAGSALLAARLSDRLAETRGLESVHRVSSFVIHDLKNCVSGLSLTLANARNGLDDPSFRPHLMTAMEESVSAMERVIERVAGVSGEAEPSLESVELGDLIERALARAGVTQPGSQTESAINLDGAAEVRVDPEQLLTVLENLITNSLEAMNGMGRIEVTGRSGGNGSVLLRISDSGPGIEPEMAMDDVLFSAFRTTKPGGLGIGLYQSRRIMEAMGGSITLVDGRDGAAFELWIPTAAPRF
jgi:putative PEP-CTERM system histidine kinase